MLSSKTTDIYDYSKQNTVIGSNVSAGEIAISSKKDTNITGSNVVADNDVSVKAGGNLNIGSAEQTSEYRKSVKKSCKEKRCVCWRWLGLYHWQGKAEGPVRQPEY